MAASELGDEGLTSINITPMVDVMLVLLVIFMVATSALSNLEGLDVDRPDAATGDPLTSSPDAEILLTCRPDGSFAVDGTAVAGEAEIAAAIRDKRSRRADLKGIVACDEEASVRALVRLLDLLREGGVHAYAITTEPPRT